MDHAQVRFEREGIEGAVPVGCTIADAAGRMGVRLGRCDDSTHSCRVTVTSGIDHLNELGEADREHLSDELRSSNRRLACMAHTTKPGEIVIMTEEHRPEEPTTTTAAGANLKDQFDALPLDQKFSQLLQMEMSALNDAARYVADTSMKAFEKLGDALSEIGQKVETEAKKAVEVNKDPEPAPVAEEPVVPSVEPETTENTAADEPRNDYTPPGQV